MSDQPLILYGHPISPYVRKVHVALLEHGMAFENLELLGQDQSPDFREASPLGLIPAIRHADFMLSDSSAIIAYLEALSGPRLLPAAARDRGRAIWFDEFADTALLPSCSLIFYHRWAAPALGLEGDPAAAEAVETGALPAQLDILEQSLAGRDWLVGNAFTLADLAVAAGFVNLAIAGWTLDNHRWPALVAHQSRVSALPSFRTAANVALDRAAAMAPRHPRNAC